MAQPQQPEVIFFLGAGASMKAGVPDTYKLVTDFQVEIKDDHKLAATISRMIEILKKWKGETDPEDDRVDVELLLEALDRLRTKDRDILLRFYKTHDYLLRDYSEKLKPFNNLRDYIKKRAVVSRDAIEYLQPLLAMLNGYSPLDIFSVNYDTLIEQFATLHKKQFSDGFEIEWNRESFARSKDIRLYKLHGSVTWYKTKEASYVKVPVRAETDEIPLITGETATSLILYPMRKWDYDEPLLDLLMMLKSRLLTAKYCIVVGYSFRDEPINRIFWDAARQNTNLHLVLISPHSPKIYDRKLKFYSSATDPRVQSSLSGRVVTLPYKFEDIFFELTNSILGQLISALRLEVDARNWEIAQGTADWGPTIKGFIDAEHYDKVTGLLSRTPWNVALKTWQDRIQYTFKLWLLSSIRGDSLSSEQWATAFQSAITDFDTEKLNSYVVNQLVALNFVVSPTFTTNPKSLFDAIQPILLLARRRANMFREPLGTHLSKAVEALEDIQAYLSLWENGAIPIQKYLGLRTPDPKNRGILTLADTPSPTLDYQAKLKNASEAVGAIEQNIWTNLMIKLRSAVTKHSIV